MAPHAATQMGPASAAAALESSEASEKTSRLIGTQTCALLSPVRFFLFFLEKSWAMYTYSMYVVFACLCVFARICGFVLSSYYVSSCFILPCFSRDSCVWFCSSVMKFHCYGRPSVLFRQSFALGREFITFRFADGSQAAWNEWQVETSGHRAIEHHSSIVASNAARIYLYSNYLVHP